MSEPIGGVGRPSVQGIDGVPGGAAPAATAPASVLPAPTTDLATANGDVTAMLYALTAAQRDKATSQQAQAAERKGTERQQAFMDMQTEIQEAKEAQEDSSWLGDVMDVVDSVTGAVVGGNPLQDLAHDLSKATGIGAFEIAYDFIRPDALLNGAVMLASAATGKDELQQTYDAATGGSSMKTRFQGAADVSECPEVMKGYEVAKDSMAAAMVTVGTCGTGAVAIVAISASAALMAEAKFDGLGRLGMGDKAKMWTRLGAQTALLAFTVTASIAEGAKDVATATAKAGAEGAKAGAKSANVAADGARYAVDLINGTNQVVRGSVQVGQSIYDRDVADHMTASAQHQNEQHRADREQQRLISGLREITTSYQRTLASIAGSLQELDQTSLTLAHQIA